MKQKTLDQFLGAAVAAYILTYAILTYVLLAHSSFSKPGDIILGEVAVIANVLLGLVLSVFRFSPRFQIIGSLIMLFTYAFYQILSYRFISVGQISQLFLTPVVLLMLPLLLPLVVGVVREMNLNK